MIVILGFVVLIIVLFMFFINWMFNILEEIIYEIINVNKEE